MDSSKLLLFTLSYQHTKIISLTFIRRQRRKFIYMFNGVATVRDAKTKFKVKALEETVPEIVLLNHSELGHFFVSYYKLNPAKQQCQSNCLTSKYTSKGYE